MSQVVPRNLVQEAVAGREFDDTVIRVGDLTSGQLDGTSIPEDTPGVIGTLEVGEDDPVADAAAVIVGEYMGNDPRVPEHLEDSDPAAGFVSGQTEQGRPDIKVQESTPGDPAQNPMVWISGGAQETFTEKELMSPRPWDRLTTDQVSNITDIKPIRPGEKPQYVPAGRHINLVVQPTTGAETYSLSDSSGYFPILKWVP